VSFHCLFLFVCLFVCTCVCVPPPPQCLFVCVMLACRGSLDTLEPLFPASGSCVLFLDQLPSLLHDCLPPSTSRPTSTYPQPSRPWHRPWHLFLDMFFPLGPAAIPLARPISHHSNIDKLLDYPLLPGSFISILCYLI
jgi:hypothetical protein